MFGFVCLHLYSSYIMFEFMFESILEVECLSLNV